MLPGEAAKARDRSAKNGQGVGDAAHGVRGGAEGADDLGEGLGAIPRGDPSPAKRLPFHHDLRTIPPSHFIGDLAKGGGLKEEGPLRPVQKSQEIVGGGSGGWTIGVVTETSPANSSVRPWEFTTSTLPSNTATR